MSKQTLEPINKTGQDNLIKSKTSDVTVAKKEGNVCIGIGAGVGALGTASWALGSAFCPLCIVATPALIGVGLYKRLSAKHLATKEVLNKNENT